MKYKIFGRSGLRVSELGLGAMTFGDEWGWGADRRTSQQIFDAYAEAGGNFIDTANFYTEGSSEGFVGEFIQDDRDHFVLATKYTLRDREGDPNFSGNHRKNMVRSVEASLRRLDTSYIDLLWLNAWDFTTPAEEIMRGLDDLVRSGKILHVGICNTPAWIIAQANTLAELRGWTAFCGIQVEYNLLERGPERELLPMAQALGLAVTPWAPLGAGLLTGKYLDGNGGDGRLTADHPGHSGQSRRITGEVVALAKDLGASPAQIALSWLRQKPSQIIIPLVGARKLNQLRDSLGCLDLTLAPEQIRSLDEISRIDPGSPYNYLERRDVRFNAFSGMAERIDNHRLK